MRSRFSMYQYRIVGKMGEGTFSEVLKCQSHVDGKLYACKKMKQKYESVEQVNNLREIQALRRLNPHPNIIELKEIVLDRQSNTLSLICELMDMNIYEFIKDRKTYLPEQKVRMYMYQLCKSLYHMHKNGIFHRDVKPENILIKDNVLKLADFGSCKSVYSKHPYTEYISTRWYRAPECLLTDGYYGHKMDMWSVGCVVYEVMTLRPLFPGANELDQVSRIHDVVGSPSPPVLEKFKKYQSRHMDFNFPSKTGSGISPMLKHGSKGCVDLITQLCTYDPDARISAKQALKHPYFKDVREAERKAKKLTLSATSGDIIEGRLVPINATTIDVPTLRLPRNNPPPAVQKKRRKSQKSQSMELSGDELYISKYKKRGSFMTSSRLGVEGAGQDSFLPSIKQKKYHYHPQLQSTIPSGYNSMAVSNKSTARNTFFPPIYGNQVASKHALFQSPVAKPPHQHSGRQQHNSHLPAISKRRTGAG